MKSLFWMAAVVVAITMMIAGGAALAGEKKAPAYGTWEFQAALETGTLPTDPTIVQAGPRKLGFGDVGSFIYMGQPYTEGYEGSSGMKPSVINVGGSFYRVGVDTP